jgi:leucyl-tRNA synthetase
MKIEIERHWQDKLTFRTFDKGNVKDKFYVLSMFPYPSGSLHMGHVRVYSISDAVARFYRFIGKNVFHPMGFDAFGLPAENAALQRKIPADEWTQQNITHMKQQLNKLGCSFDWSAELATCDASYYKWTQKLFLMLYNDGLAYQCESMVNWDPVDKTVLADEQVDESGCSWRSGAKVERRLLKQWFIKTTKFAEQLYAGLSDPILNDWRDIINLQKHWIGECNGWNFTLKLDNDKHVTVWTNTPEDLNAASFIAIKREHLLNQENIEDGLLKMKAKNPFGNDLPIIVASSVNFPPFNDVYLGVPFKNEHDNELTKKYNIKVTHEASNESDREIIIQKAKESQIGAEFKISSKLRDWLISRQRFWGTPIPIIHCGMCGAVPVDEKDLPIKLPEMKEQIGRPLNENEEWQKCNCPKCGGEAKRETDTMDTFVDSSWYFLRYLDVENSKDLVDKDLSRSMMPVDLYIGGKEHAVLHLYYSRFVNHFLHQKGYVKHPEPFQRLLVQGMVKGKSYRVKNTGKYLNADQVDVISEKKGKAFVKDTKEPVEIMWEKMSKSKFNGVDPIDVINTYGSDTTRLIMLGDVAPTSHRNWSEATFPGIINWQKRMWLTMHDFHFVREKAKEMIKSSDFDDHEAKLLDSANYFASGATFNFKVTHQLSVGMSKMQGLTNTIRRAPADVVALGEQYERALSAQIIMLAPLAPSFASELWARFISAPNRVAEKSLYIDWNAGVFEQKWPIVDANHKIEFCVKINNQIAHKFKCPCGELNKMSQEEATRVGLGHELTVKQLKNKPVIASHWRIIPDYEGILSLTTEQSSKEKQINGKNDEGNKENRAVNK